MGSRNNEKASDMGGHDALSRSKERSSTELSPQRGGSDPCFRGFGLIHSAECTGGWIFGCFRVNEATDIKVGASFREATCVAEFH